MNVSTQPSDVHIVISSGSWSPSWWSEGAPRRLLPFALHGSCTMLSLNTTGCFAMICRGQITSLGLRTEAKRAFRTKHDVSEDQYRCLAQLFNEEEVGDISAVHRCSLGQTGEAVRPRFTIFYCPGQDMLRGRHASIPYRGHLLWPTWPWESGEQPDFIATKSGRTILSTSLLTEAAYTMCRMRCART